MLLESILLAQAAIQPEPVYEDCQTVIYMSENNKPQKVLVINVQVSEGDNCIDDSGYIDEWFKRYYESRM